MSPHRNFMSKLILVVLWLAFSATTGYAQWVRNDPKNHEAIVFVHGLMGDARGTWTSGSTSWPEMLTSDPDFNGVNIYMYGYNSPLRDNALTLNQIEGNMWNRLVADGVVKSDKLMFVSHSMGGILTRALILRNSRILAPKIRFLYFFATPTTGSASADIGKFFSNNPQFGQLLPLDQGQNTLIDQQRDDWRGAGMTKLRSFCAYETKPTKHLVIVVSMVSATDLCTEPTTAIETDHINIV